MRLNVRQTACGVPHFTGSRWFCALSTGCRPAPPSNFLQQSRYRPPSTLDFAQNAPETPTLVADTSIYIPSLAASGSPFPVFFLLPITPYIHFRPVRREGQTGQTVGEATMLVFFCLEKCLKLGFTKDLSSARKSSFTKETRFTKETLPRGALLAELAPVGATTYYTHPGEC